MDVKKLLKEMFTPGTLPCVLFGAAIGLVFAVLWLTIGVGKTLLIGLFCLIGAFVGGVPNKIDFIRNLILRIHPGDEDQY